MYRLQPAPVNTYSETGQTPPGMCTAHGLLDCAWPASISAKRQVSSAALIGSIRVFHPSRLAGSSGTDIHSRRPAEGNTAGRRAQSVYPQPPWRHPPGGAFAQGNESFAWGRETILPPDRRADVSSTGDTRLGLKAHGGSFTHFKKNAMRPTDIPDLKSAAFLADRYPTYRRLQSDFPHFEIDINGEDCIVLTRYSDVDEVLRNPLATVQQAPGVFPDRIGNGAGARFYRESLPNIDAPDHTRIRRIVTPAFNPRTVANMRGWVEKVIVEHLDRLEGQDEIDFVSAFADPVPAEIACRLLHVPLSDARELFARQHGLNAVLSVSDITPERLAERMPRRPSITSTWMMCWTRSGASCPRTISSAR